MIGEPEIGTTASAQLVVEDRDLASSISRESQDKFPPVFATARMVALMETAAARVLREFLETDELSVGVSVDVSHTAATPLGIAVTANARYVGRENKLWVFEIWAEDNGGEIGRGMHKRAVVNVERLLAGATRRNATSLE
ncbi:MULTISPECIES: thioesterase family protein [Nostocales]|uniref:Thioesterase n=2 Tax=Nostocales TaxID=1161 RepID=A0A0C1QXB8_9CYAN|nr:hotdog domain-containing protein [Tolypothrix bouteillei]KAF3886040.1 thioesterase [Tolypothrix bouteillei VB521301]